MESKRIPIPTLKNKKHMAFVIDYLKTFNATQSYMRVYNSDSSSAQTSASRILSLPEVEEFIHKYLEYESYSKIELNNKRLSLLLADRAGIVLNIFDMANSKDHKYPALKLQANKLLARVTGLIDGETSLMEQYPTGKQED